MKILAMEIEKRKDPVEKALLQEEARRVYALYQEGKIREIYFCKQDHTAVIFLEVKDIPEARKIIRTFPLVQSGYIDFNLVELIPYSGYDRIMTNE